MHGGPWLEAYCFDGVKRMCHICGKMGRKVRIAVGDVVLISLRGFQVRRYRYFIFLNKICRAYACIAYGFQVCYLYLE